MKNAIILIAILLNTIILSAQDSEPTAWEFNLDGTQKAFTPNTYLQTKFLTGFQWSGSLKMNNALRNNVMANHGYQEIDSGGRYDTMLIINQPMWLDYSYNPGFWYAPFMQFEPTLPLTKDNFGQILRPADSANPIFGFLYRKGTISQNPSDSNYSRLMLYKDSLSNYGTDSIVLKEIYPQPKFKTRDFEGFSSEGQTDNYLGRKWFLAINLRRLNSNFDTISDDSSILTIKMPYTLWNGNTGTIRFDSIPIDHQDSVEHWNYYEDRGFAQKMRYETSRPDSITITKKMLPIGRNYQDITITAEFNTFDRKNVYGNPPFSDDLKDTSSIELIDIIVKYHGKLDIAIQDIKIESINAFYLLKGRLDSIPPFDSGRLDGRGFIDLHTDPEHENDSNYIEQPNGIKQIIQSCIDSMKVKSHNWADAKLFRFYYQDTECDKFYWWGPLRYCNKLSNGMFVTRDWQNYCEIYSYYTKCPNRYLGIKINEHEQLLCAPFIGHGNQQISTFGYKSGFSNFPDSTKSDFETFVSFSDSILINANVNSDSSYTHYRDVLLDANDCLQPQWEQATIRSYYDKSRYSFLYSDKNWWMNYFVGAAISGNSTDGYLVANLRQKTGEEIRLLLMNGILMGAKGILMDRESTGEVLPKEIFTGIGDGTKLDSTYTNFYSDSVGADYFTTTTDDWGLTGSFPDSLYSNMKIQIGSFYTGELSTRKSIKEVFNFIRANDNLLMSMHLSAWYGKGFKSWYNQHPRFNPNDTILNKYVNILNISTKKLYQPIIGTGYVNQIVKESKDSSFFDIAIHSIGTDTLMEKSFVLAVQNRRTDPLVYTIDTINYVINDDQGGVTSAQMINSGMKFYSTAEFDKNCRNGGEILGPNDYADENNEYVYERFRDATYWRNLWWKRLGSRSMTINFKKFNDSTKLNKLRITELLDGSTNNSTYFWEREKYANRIDTLIDCDSSLTIRFLAAEMKMLKIELLEETAPPFTGELAFSNQHKLVVYPTKQTSNIDFNGKDTMVYYHAVYHKRNAITGKNSVFYRRSFPYNANGFDQIYWEPEEKLISTKLVVKREIEPNLNVDSVEVDSCNCKYPSIVVRFDTVANSQKAYIVYNCEQAILCDTPKVYVVESVIDCDEPYQAIMPDSLIYPIGFAYSNQGNELSMNTWGVPVVNASANGNYYTWADSISGIFAGYKVPNDRGIITNKEYIRYYNTSNIKSIQPSLNVYSRIANGENDCALVWVEIKPKPQFPIVDSTSVHYSMLKLDVNGNIYNTVPNGILDPSQPRFASILYNGNGSAQLNNTSILKCSYPTVIRPAQYFVRPGYEVIDSTGFTLSTWDRVYWESKPLFALSKSIIYQKMLDIRKDLNLWNCLAPFSIFGFNKSLLNPNVMQGKMRDYYDGAFIHNILGSDSSFVLGFTTQLATTGIDTLNSEIWLFPHGFWNIYYDPLIDWGNIDTVLTPGDPNLWVLNRGKGINPQLAKSPIVNRSLDWKRNAQIYQAVGNDIFVTKQYFYRKNAEDDKMKIHPIMSFVGNDGVDESGISFFELNNFNKPTIKFMGRKNDKYEYLDTIQTEWFRIENIEELSFISENIKNSTAKLMIERKKDGKIFDLQSKIFSESQTSKNRVHLLNGKNEQYRILFAKKDSNSLLNFSFMLAKDSELTPNDNLIDADRVGKSTITEFESYIDLNNESYESESQTGIQINIYPNPADEKIYVSAYLPIDYIISNNNENNQLEIIIVTSIGSEIYKGEISAGETKAIETTTYPNGIYFVKISKSGSELSTQNKMFIIKR